MVVEDGMSVDRGEPEAAGELRGRRLAELTEILERQEKLLSHKKFIAKLPDRGKKILDYTEKVRAAIAEHNRRQKTTDLLSAVKLQFPGGPNHIKESAETSVTVGDTCVTSSAGSSESRGRSSGHADAEDRQLSHELETISLPASNESDTDGHLADALASSLKMISIQDRGDVANGDPSETSAGNEKTESSLGASGEKKFQYLDVIERRATSGAQSRERFKTNRLPSELSSSSPHQSPGDEALRLSAEQRKLQDRKHLDDITAARLPPLHHFPAQLLPLDESLTLQITQKKTFEEKQAKLAAQKLFEKLNIKMGPFNPEGDSYMKYRDRGDDDLFGV